MVAVALSPACEVAVSVGAGSGKAVVSASTISSTGVNVATASGVGVSGARQPANKKILNNKVAILATIRDPSLLLKTWFEII
jgi:hypothetical protein